MDKLSDYTKAVIRWREALSILPDNHFFELVRIYIGVVKTPYNKQKLIEQLSNFICKEENKTTLLRLLSETDMVILTAILLLPNATHEKISELFADNFNYAALYERLLNLEERLIIYSVYEPRIEKEIFLVNPILKESLEKLTTEQRLLPEAEKNSTLKNNQKIIPEFFCAFITFVNMNPALCKSDETLKKRQIAMLPEYFPQNNKNQFFELLIKAAKNLGLFRDCDGELRTVLPRWKIFSELNEKDQIVWLSVADRMYPRQEMFRRAQLVSDLLEKIPKNGFSKSILFRAAYLLNEKTTDIAGSSIKSIGRFAALLEQNSKHETEQTGINSILENIETFGLLQKGQTEAEGEIVYKATQFDTNQKLEKAISIDAGFNITLMPGLSLNKLLLLTQIADLKRYDTVSSYEISRQSCMRSFDAGFTPETIISGLKEILVHEIPTNLIDSIEEWYKNFESATLYRGYVLKVTDDKQILVEKNKELSEHIKKILAPGIYLLDFETEEEAKESIEKSMLDFIGQVKTFRKETTIVPFPAIAKTQKPTAEKIEETDENEKKQSGVLATEKERAEIFNQMRQELDKLNIPAEQAEGLRLRIQRKIILNPSQLRPESVKAERIEAGGMDFQGKVHVIEYAVSTGNMIELVYDDSNSENGTKELLGTPIAIEKHTGDYMVKIRIEPSKEIQTLSIGRARTVKRIRGSIFRG